MPHADNRPWMQLLVGEMPTAPRRMAVSDIVDSRGMWDLSHLNQNLPATVERLDQEIARSSGGPVMPAELYVPTDAPPKGFMLYMHGGGWCAGSVANERQVAMRFAELGIAVLSPEYRLAPENPFPAAVEDCVDALRWIATSGDAVVGLAIAADGVIVGGQSAGANLAAVMASVCASNETAFASADSSIADVTAPDICVSGAVLLSGIYSFPLLLERPGSNIGPAEVWHQAYLGGDFLRRNRDPLASPMFSGVGGFPPTYISCGDEDSFLPQSLQFADLLTSNNVPTTLSVSAGLDHGFPFVEDTLAGADTEMQRVRRWVTALIGEAT